MTEATILTTDQRPVLRLERRLADPPPVVWKALTDREQLRSWFPCDVIVEGGHWVVGASILFPFPPEVADMVLTGEVLAVREDRELSFSWGEEILRFELHAVEDGTQLVLFDELPSSWAARNAAGWEVCLDRLAGFPPEEAAWQPHFDRYSVSFEPALGPQEGPPSEYKGE